MHLGSLESTQEARVALTLLSCHPNFPRASITRYTHAKHEPILNFDMLNIYRLPCISYAVHLTHFGRYSEGF